MKEIIEFVDRYYPEHHRSPSCREIAAHTSMKRSTVHNYLVLIPILLRASLKSMKPL